MCRWSAAAARNLQIANVCWPPSQLHRLRHSAPTTARHDDPPSEATLSALQLLFFTQVTVRRPPIRWVSAVGFAWMTSVDKCMQALSPSEPHIGPAPPNQHAASAEETSTPAARTETSLTAELRPLGSVPTLLWGREGRRLTRLSTASPEQRAAATEPCSRPGSARTLDFQHAWGVDEQLLGP